ncbi:MAG: hypothetical protein CSA32_00810 [Desulfobulbus propionicus]|nr:MAG: hypothetical protein CSA32_00810 [Desulfobulbus propionicus]
MSFYYKGQSLFSLFTAWSDPFTRKMKRDEKMNKTATNIPTLKEALEKPQKNRDMALALEAMDNYSRTPGGLMGNL